MQCGLNAAFDCIKAFSETDFTEDLKKIDMPSLIIHGDDDEIVPIGASAMLSSKMIKNARLEIYQGAPHGLCSTLKDKINADLLAFLNPDAAISGRPMDINKNDTAGRVLDLKSEVGPYFEKTSG